jgi:trigger factor
VKVAVETLDPCKKKLVIEVPEEDVKKEYQSTIHEFRKEAMMPGFRKGRIPVDLIRTRFKKQIEGEVKSKLLQTSYEEALKENSIFPIFKPEIDQEKLTLVENQPFKYEVTVEIKPEVKIENYKGVKVNKPVPKPVTDESVQRGLEELQKQHIHYRECAEDYTIKEDDMLVIDYDGFIDNKPVKNGSARDYSLVVGSGTMIPGFEDQFIGRKKGDAFEFILPFPQDHLHRELAEQNVRFSVKIRDAKEGYLLPLDDEFAKDLELDSLEELKAKIKKGIEEELRKETDNRVKLQIVNTLIHNNTIPVPPSLVAYERVVSKISEEEATRRVQGTLLLENIAKQENMTISEDELDEEIKRLAVQHNQHPTALKKSLKERGTLENIRIDLLTTKTLDFLVAQADITEES